MKKENSNYMSYAAEIFDYFKRMDANAGEGGPYLQWLDGKHSVTDIRHAKFLRHTVKNLILTGYLEMKDARFICLTQHGYDFTQGGVLLCNSINLIKFVDLQRDVNTQFNQLWEIIGNNDTALFYVDGNSYYRLASSLLDGLPYDYTTFVRSLDKSKQSRSVWYRDLYYAIDDAKKSRFLSGLSEIITNIYEEYYPTQQNAADEEDMLELMTSATEPVHTDQQKIKKMDKKIKIFISHSSNDAKVVEAFVDLLMILGVKEAEQMFCSSCPPFDVKVNDDIFETLKDQYEKYQLFMIYMLSDNYYNSPVCLNEMGAGWVLQYDYQCITLPGFSVNSIKGCVNVNRKALVLDSKNMKFDLNNFKDKIIKLMDLPEIDSTIWEMKRDRFIEDIA